MKKRKTIALCLLIALTAALFATLCACGTQTAEKKTDKQGDGKQAAHEHAFTKWTVETEPTCTTVGEEVSACSCGEKSSREIPAAGHKFGAWKTTKSATCIATGREERTCEVCEYVETRTVAKSAHTYGAFVTLLAPTCTHEGLREKVCSVCGDEVMETLAPLGHSYGEWDVTTEPTCTEKGSRKRICSTCKEVFVEEIPATGHDFGEWEVTTAPTCRTAGARRRVCETCGAGEEEELPERGHLYGEWEYAYATPVSVGVAYRFCARCGDKEREELDPISCSVSLRQRNEYEAVNETTTKRVVSVGLSILNLQGGVAPYAVSVTVWDEVAEKTIFEETYDAAAHFRFDQIVCTFSEYYERGVRPESEQYETLRAPALICVRVSDAQGVVTTYTGHAYDVDGAPLAVEQSPYGEQESHEAYHEHADWEVPAGPLCASGVVAHAVCPVCGEALTKAFAPAAHTFEGEWEIVKEATCSEAGVRKQMCSVCGEEVTEAIEPVPHTYGEWEIVKAATCTEAGSRKHTCSVCHAEETEEIEPVAHTFGNWEIVKAATCTEAGSRKHTCSVCHAEETEEIEPVAHTFGNWEIVKEATCSEAGSRKRTCSACHETETERLPADPALHAYENGVCKACGAHTHTEGLVFSESGDFATVTGYTGDATSVYIAPLYNHKKVTGIAASAFREKPIAFLSLPATLRTVGRDAFASCEALVSVAYEGSVEDWLGVTFASEHASPLACASTFTAAGVPVTTVTVAQAAEEEETRTRVNAFAFYGYGGLTSVTLAASADVGERAFSGCAGLTEITIEAGATLGEQAFYGCVRLARVRLTGTYTRIDGMFAFGLRENKIRFEYDGDVGDWCAIAFADDAEILRYAEKLVLSGEETSELTVPATVSSVPSRAFYGYAGLTGVTFAEGVDEIGWRAFADCASLVTADVANSVKKIAENAFLNCPVRTATLPTYALSGLARDNLRSVTFRNGETIDEGAFSGCGALESVAFGAQLTSVGNNAFRACGKLTSVTFPAGIRSVGTDAFYGCESLVAARYEGNVAGWHEIDFANEYANPLLYAHKLYVGDALVTALVVSGATAIKDYAYIGCEALTSVTVGEGVTAIGKSAFDSCRALETLTIADTVTSIGRGAFYNCASLTEATIPGGVLAIGEYAFWGCEALRTVTLSAGVTTIGNYAFYNCHALTSVTIPASVTSIGTAAFLRCVALEEIVFGGTTEEWNAVEKGVDFDRDAGEYAVRCTDGE